MPCCSDHRINSCPDVALYFVASDLTVLSFIFNARTSGAYASTTMLLSWQTFRMAVRVLKGCTYDTRQRCPGYGIYASIPLSD